MPRIVCVACLLFVLGCNDRHETPPDDKVKVKINAPGVNVEVEGKKTK